MGRFLCLLSLYLCPRSGVVLIDRARFFWKVRWILQSYCVFWVILFRVDNRGDDGDRDALCLLPSRGTFIRIIITGEQRFELAVSFLVVQLLSNRVLEIALTQVVVPFIRVPEIQAFPFAAFRKAYAARRKTID